MKTFSVISMVGVLERPYAKLLSHQSGVRIAFKNIADRRGTRCAIASNAMCALCNRP